MTAESAPASGRKPSADAFGGSGGRRAALGRSAQAPAPSLLEMKPAAVRPDLKALLQLAETDLDAVKRRLCTEFPQLSLLEDATSYGATGAEVGRSLKSMLMLARFVTGDLDGLGGKDRPKIEIGLERLSQIVEQGLRDLGDRNIGLGIQRMLTILSLHDLGKSESIAKAAKAALNVEDHDVVISQLVRSNFEPLRGHIEDAEIDMLKNAVRDPVVRKHFADPRGVSGSFNAGRHMQGEAPLQLFLDNVRGVDPINLAEWIADWSGINGHTDLGGAVALSHIAPAVNGTAVALHKLLEAGSGSRTPEALRDLWQEFSYPATELERLGLRMSTPEDRAITRLAFMGREQQVADPATANQNIEGLRAALASVPIGMREQIVVELNRPDLDLGFTPHTVQGLKNALSSDANGPKMPVAAAYETFLRVLHRVIEKTRAEKLERPLITTNLDVKTPGASIYEVAAEISMAGNHALSPEEIVSRIDLHTSVAKDAITMSASVRSDPPSSLEGLVRQSLGELPGKTWLLGGLGGGGDAYQAEATALLLEARGKSVPATFSVRRAKSVEEVLEKLSGHEVVDRKHGIIRITADTSGVTGSTNRLPERGVARATDRPIYYLIDTTEGAQLHRQIEALSKLMEEKHGMRIDGVGGIDTGGDVLEGRTKSPGNQSISTPDQDRAGVEALSRLGGNTRVFLWGIGIDTPSDHPATLEAVDAHVHELGKSDAPLLGAYYGKTGLGEDDSVFSRTSLAVGRLTQEGGVLGHRFVEGIPLDKRTDLRNPWISTIPFTADMNAVVHFSPERLLAVKPS